MVEHNSNQKPSFIVAISVIVISSHLLVLYLLLNLTIPEKKLTNIPLIKIHRIEIELLDNSKPSENNSNSNPKLHNTVNTPEVKKNQQQFTWLLPKSDATDSIHSNAYNLNNDVSPSDLIAEFEAPTYTLNEFTYDIDDTDNLASQSIQNTFDNSDYFLETSKPTETTDSLQTNHDALQDIQHTNTDSITTNQASIQDKSTNNDTISNNKLTYNQTKPINETSSLTVKSNPSASKTTPFEATSNSTKINDMSEESHQSSSNDFSHLIIAQNNHRTIDNISNSQEPIVLTSKPIYASDKEIANNMITPINPSRPKQLINSPTGNWRVIVRFYVDKQGEIMQAPEPIVTTSSGNLLIDEDALSLVKKTRFHPFKREGKPQIAEITLPLTYQ